MNFDIMMGFQSKQFWNAKVVTGKTVPTTETGLLFKIIVLPQWYQLLRCCIRWSNPLSVIIVANKNMKFFKSYFWGKCKNLLGLFFTTSCANMTNEFVIVSQCNCVHCTSEAWQGGSCPRTQKPRGHKTAWRKKWDISWDQSRFR